MESKVYDEILKTRLVAIIRANDPGKLLDAVKAIRDGGVTVMEVSLVTPNALETIRLVADNVDGIFIGAGTVVSAEDAKRSIDAGSEFLVSPVAREEVIREAQRQKKCMLAGALTPTEVLQAWDWGSDFVKVFPTGELGASYIKSLKAPLPQVDMVAVGGVTLENAADFIKAGCHGVGVGSSLVQPQLLENNDFEGLKKRASEFVCAVSGQN